MSAEDAVAQMRRSLTALTSCVEKLRDEYGDTLGVRRISSDLARFASDLDELGPPAPGHRPARDRASFEEIPDEPYDEKLWGSDAESESSHAH